MRLVCMHMYICIIYIKQDIIRWKLFRTVWNLLCRKLRSCTDDANWFFSLRIRSAVVTVRAGETWNMAQQILLWHTPAKHEESDFWLMSTNRKSCLQRNYADLHQPRIWPGTLLTWHYGHSSWCWLVKNKGPHAKKPIRRGSFDVSLHLVYI